MKKQTKNARYGYFYEELEIMKKNKTKILDRTHSTKNMSSKNN